MGIVIKQTLKGLRHLLPRLPVVGSISNYFLRAAAGA